jgi:hypothetical protein
MKTENTNNNIVDYKFDGYEFVRKNGRDEIVSGKIGFFEKILKEKQLSDETVEQYMEQINNLVD